ncbi:tautomerase family protein [Microbulbifer epialgicus]|uniref:4-oxalocrotonate tautomerase family protein n=1 Tax=Microbulbifer epialgicus TaxID=393907 RepID=A0ABV4NYM0_9GAMM
MPIISYTTVEGALTEDQKSDLCKALTDAVTATLGSRIKPNVWVTLNETPEGNYFIGGHPLKAKHLKKLIETNEFE